MFQPENDQFIVAKEAMDNDNIGLYTVDKLLFVAVILL